MNNSFQKSRTYKEKLNISISLLQQAITLICGIIVPKLMIKEFGSEAYGTTVSISNFLSYIVLFESGMGAVTRSVLYKAFASKSNEELCAVITETKVFYKKIAVVFAFYVVFLALIFNQISHSSVFSYWYSFGLVIVIALSTFAEYFVGISYSILLQADQLNYITVIFRVVTTLLNTVAIVILLSYKCDLLLVKFISSIFFVIRPIFLALYVKKRYHLKEVYSRKKYLNNKGYALAQHIAWTLHKNTDITVLTIFSNESLVSVYSVYYMIIGHVESFMNSFLTGMEAVFGNMYANGEHEKLQKTFGYYEALISLLSVTFLSVTAVLIVPFVKLYTFGITDAEYINLPFALILILAILLFSMRTPYGNMVISAGHFKETRIAAYGEAIINILSSVIFVIKLGIVGVAIGTVLATLFRFIYYVIYLSKNILHRKISLWVKRIITNFFIVAMVFLIDNAIISKLSINNYFEWAFAGLIATIVAGLLSFTTNYILYKDDILAIIEHGFKNKINKKKA